MSAKRTIFEDVGDAARTQRAPTPGLIDATALRNARAIRRWLFVLAGLVALMVVVGGLTRLTDSGLSITEWQPIKGALPPLTDAAWNEAFAKYQAIPEYRIQNREMTLAGFKSIYWWEWSHRQLGRLIGLVWAAGFFWFAVRRRIPQGWTGQLLALGALGGAQGLLGWWMVSSGLSGRMVDVASYRLAMHLGLAFAILSLMIWQIHLLSRGQPQLLQARRARETGLARLTGVLFGLIFFQILLGALVAGIDAGRGYIDWPLMNGEFLPSESFDYTPLWTNLFENPALVQFDHRMVGYLAFALTLFVWWKSRQSPHVATRATFTIMLGAVILQVLLGITTVLYAAPWHVAIVHQIGALAVVAAVLKARFAAAYPPSRSLRPA